MTSPSPTRPTVRILERDVDLAVGVPPAEVARATVELVAPVIEPDWDERSGPWGIGDRGLGLLLVDGLLLREVRILATRSAELLGSGDVLRPSDVDGEFTLPVPTEVSWTVLEPLTVALLDEDFLVAACRHPSVLARLLGRAVGRAKSLAVHEAVTNLKHVETRLLVQFWHLAERWGRVGMGGVTVPLPLTHDLLARLVGAARPSVTTALGRLAERGEVVRTESGWRLDPASRATVSNLTD
ncbi:MAG TPA: Crp/Fnr family transcriptional regulator [Thermoleophilaceae bacterium]|nr:Crp/Fnr family transcriptional regulator [Thermoleophilaceae bacterium]